MTATYSQKLAPQETNQRKINTAINKVIEGRTENYGQVTLGQSTTQTVVTLTDATVSENSVIMMMPRTANAAALSPYISSIANGTFTITHASDANTDLTFDYIWVG
ncbi:MAG: hypothetical protein EP341_03080 [Sphingomonadales bacterium]|nr:MAG: hypothetical protein EP341_03080 [Sphingomonadales bacterium]